MEGKMHKIIHK